MLLLIFFLSFLLDAIHVLLEEGSEFGFQLIRENTFTYSTDDVAKKICRENKNLQRNT